MKYDADELEWVTTMVRIAAKDREEYRKLRQATWDLVAIEHERQTPQEREVWLENAS